MSLADDILDYVKRNPHVTAGDVTNALQRRSWAAGFFGVDSFWTALLARPGYGRVFVAMWRMEEDGKLTSKWGTPREGCQYRPRLYWPTGCGND